jgi:hypothetical protein
LSANTLSMINFEHGGDPYSLLAAYSVLAAIPSSGPSRALETAFVASVSEQSFPALIAVATERLSVGKQTTLPRVVELLLECTTAGK